MVSKQQQFVSGLRELAAFMEAHPEMKMPQKRTINIICYHKEEIADVARNLGSCKKFTNQWTIGLRKQFGPLVLQFSWYRGQVCKRVNVGTEKVISRDWSKAPLESTEQPKYKWVCPPSFLDACCEEGAS